MPSVQIRSVCSPFDSPAAAHLAVAVVVRAEAMGLLLWPETIEVLDMPLFRRLAEAAAREGIGNGLLAELAASSSPDQRRLLDTLAQLNEALESSPTPACEWHGVVRILDRDTLARLLGIPFNCMRRYLSGSSATPDEIAARLHFLALVVGDLAGAYNEFGIHRWFKRPRKLLSNRSPAEILSGEWQPEARGPQQVRGLAAALASSPAT